MDKSVGFGKVTQTEFDMAAAEGETPRNLFLNQDEPTHRSMKGAIVEAKMVDSRKRLMYFISIFCEGVY